MTPDEIGIRVRTAAIEQWRSTGHGDPPAVTRETELRADLGFDSLDIVELAMDLEESLGVEVGDDDMFTFETVGELTDYVVAARARVAA